MPIRDKSKRPDNSRPMWSVLLKKYGIWGSLRLLYVDVLPDLIHGIDTARPVDNLELTSLALAKEHNRYVPSTFGALNSSLEHISDKVDFSQSSFLDYGSGKGKALIAAARYPFSNITGVEINSELHAIACRNIARLDLAARVRCVSADAAMYEPRHNDTVLYFFNPFSGTVLEKCLETIANASRGVTRQIIYLNPTEDDVFCRYFEKWDEVNFEPGGVEVNFYVTRGLST